MNIDFSVADVAAVREVLVAVMRQACGASTDMAAVIAAEFYDGLRELQVGGRMGAYAESLRRPDATDGAVRALVQDLVDGKEPDGLAGKLLDRLDYETRRSANECMASNARRDQLRPRWARVPAGFETCDFCIMLASRGFVYHTEEAASHAHAHCDCRVVPSWDKDKPAVEGYDPDYYYNVWRGMRASTIPPSKISKYCLADKDKARAFKEYLGFSVEDAAELTQKIYAVMGAESPEYRRTDEYGERYAHDVVLEGKGGMRARVIIAWIKRPGAAKMQLVSAYVKE